MVRAATPATEQDQIVITGDMAEIRRTTTVRSMKLEDLLPHIATPPPITTPRLPRNTVFCHWDKEAGNFYVLVELEPGLHSLRHDRMEDAVLVIMPWQYFEFVFQTRNHDRDEAWLLQEAKLLWAPRRLATPEDPAIPARLPNIYQESSGICFGSTAPESRLSVSQRINQIVNEFFATTFNNHLGMNRPNGYRSFGAWAKDSLENPTCWQTWTDWENAQPMSQWLSSSKLKMPVAYAEGTIPAYQPGSSFGRAAEWLRTISATDRFRLLQAYKELSAEFGLELPVDPEAFEKGDLEELRQLQAERGITDKPKPAEAAPAPKRTLRPWCNCSEQNTHCHCDLPVTEPGTTCRRCQDGRHVEERR